MTRANWKRPNSLDYQRRKQSNVITNADEITVVHFLERDDNSKATTGKQDTITRKQMKMRLLSNSLKNRHLKFEVENPNIKISYSEFCKKKPFWVVHPSGKDRETCLCKLCENAQFMADRLLYAYNICKWNTGSALRGFSSKREPTHSCGQHQGSTIFILHSVILFPPLTFCHMGTSQTCSTSSEGE